jgi:hypothetical protein
MINLDEAWNWYVTAREHLYLFGRLGEKHRDGLGWDGPLGRDDKLKDLESETILTDTPEPRPNTRIRF